MPVSDIEPRPQLAAARASSAAALSGASGLPRSLRSMFSSSDCGVNPDTSVSPAPIASTRAGTVRGSAAYASASDTDGEIVTTARSPSTPFAYGSAWNGTRYSGPCGTITRRLMPAGKPRNASASTLAATRRPAPAPVSPLSSSASHRTMSRSSESSGASVIPRALVFVITIRPVRAVDVPPAYTSSAVDGFMARCTSASTIDVARVRRRASTYAVVVSAP